METVQTILNVLFVVHVILSTASLQRLNRITTTTIKTVTRLSIQQMNKGAVDKLIQTLLSEEPPTHPTQDETSH